MKLKSLLFSYIAAICLVARADLIVTASEPKTTGQKTVIKLELKNTFPEKIESVRAVAFLLDDKGKMIGQSTKWVIGGSKSNPGLESGKETTFNFVVKSAHPIAATNLTTKITFSRVVLEGGKLADPIKQVRIEEHP